MNNYGGRGAVYGHILASCGCKSSEVTKDITNKIKTFVNRRLRSILFAIFDQTSHQHRTLEKKEPEIS